MGRKKAEEPSTPVEAPKRTRKTGKTKEEPVTPVEPPKRTRRTGKTRVDEELELEKNNQKNPEPGVAPKTAAKSKAAKAKPGEPFYTVEFIPNPNAAAKDVTKRKQPPNPPTEAEIARNKQWWKKVKKENSESASASAGAVADALTIPGNVTGSSKEVGIQEPLKVPEVAKEVGVTITDPVPPSKVPEVAKEVGITDQNSSALVLVAGADPKTVEEPSFRLAPGVGELLNNMAASSSAPLPKSQPKQVQPQPLSVLDFLDMVTCCMLHACQ